MTMKRQFTHLHLHTPYSLLDGFTKIGDVLDKAKALGMDSCAITDHGVMFGVVEFYKEAKKRGIKPIIGCEVYTAARTHLDKEVVDRKSGHLVLLAKDKEGYQNLIKLVSIGYTNGFYYKPRVDYDLLKEYSGGLVALSACLAGDVQQLILAGRYGKAVEKAQQLEEIFGKGNFYLEMQDHGISEQKRVNLFLRQISKDTGIPLVVTNDVHYVDKKDHSSHEIMLCIQTGKKLTDMDKMEFQTNEFYFKSQEEMYQLFEDDEEALQNTNKIADMCNFDFEFGNYHLPKYEAPEGYTTVEYLQKLCDDGMKKRYPQEDKTLRQRLDYELSVINNMGYTEYFLIVWDFINYAKNHDIPVGPGRGSAAGSIVAYCLGITDIDPIKYDLLFERFLNPERVSMPDIDVDFCYERRDEVIDYVKEKYGADHVSQITTFGTLKAKQAIRDCARVMDISYDFGDKLSKMIPSQNNIPVCIDEALYENKDLKNRYDNEPKVKTLIDAARTIEDLPRHASKHAAGVLIAADAVDTYVPLYAQGDNVLAQFEMTTLEELGLLKMDFLGLRTLTVIKDTIDSIAQNRGIHLDLDRIDYEDQATFETISSGNTLGVFQLENDGVKNYMKQLKPHCIEDIIVGTSIYRPGPMMFKDVYIKNRNNESEIKYHHKKLQPILSQTKGVLIYQEQVMKIVRELAGYSYAGADLVRRAMSKKKMDTMQKERHKFIYGDEKEGIKGCIANGVDKESAEKIFDDMVDFAKYAFNKSHAAAYATIAYQTAYLKTHYTVEFMSSLMTSYIGFSESEKKIVPCKINCEENGIQILPPDVNYSTHRFTVEDGKIRFPLSALKGVGIGPATGISQERIANGQYKNFEDMARRIDSIYMNKRVVEALIKSGSLDDISYSRADVMAHYDQIIAFVSADKKSSIKGQLNFFSGDKLSGYEFGDKIKIKEFKKNILLAQEKEILGFYLSGSPLDEYKKLIDKYSSINSIQIREPVKDEAKNTAYRSRPIKSIICIVDEVKQIIDRKGNPMAFLKAEDNYSGFEVIVFASLFGKVKDYLRKDAVVYIKGRISEETEPTDEGKLLAEDIKPIEELTSIKVYVRVKDIYSSPQVSQVEKLVHSSGDAQLIFYDEKTKKAYGKTNQNIFFSEKLMSQLRAICGNGNVKVKKVN